MLKKYMIERDIPGVGGMTAGDLGNAARTSNTALAKIKGIQWQQQSVDSACVLAIYIGLVIVLYFTR